MPGFTPKPIDCKAKTARLGDNAGLVVDPYEAEDAFPASKLAELKKQWDEEYTPLLYSPRKTHYSIEKTGKRKGCVKLDDKYIHADYDLKALVLPGHESATVALVTAVHGIQNARHGLKFDDVQREVNNAIRVEMVQHGAEDEFTGHSDDTIFVFGPKNEFKELHGLNAIQQWYDNQFHNRNTLNSKFPGGVPPGVKPGIRGVVQADGTVSPVKFGKR